MKESTEKIPLETIQAQAAANPNTRRAKACANVFIQFIGELSQTGAIHIHSPATLAVGEKCLYLKLRAAMDESDKQQEQREAQALEIAQAVVAPCSVCEQPTAGTMCKPCAEAEEFLNSAQGFEFSPLVAGAVAMALLG
jgi:hypothetical protein